MSSESAQETQLYTPAMLSELLGVSVRLIRRWQREGLLQPVKQVLRLAYFDYAGLTTARQLSRWMQQGASARSIRAQLEALQARVGQPGLEGQEFLQTAPITADGKRLVLRAGNHYIEASGQFQFGFETEEPDEQPRPATLQLRPPTETGAVAPADAGLDVAGMLDAAADAEDASDLELAVDWYRAALAAGGPHPDICFQLAELLYRLDDLSGARERYLMTLELDPELVEARANLGCVLAESGQLELAIAAFEGALSQFPDYADVHFQLARVLEDCGRHGHAQEHWRRFLQLAPGSPWADEAAERLREASPSLNLLEADDASTVFAVERNP